MHRCRHFPLLAIFLFFFGVSLAVTAENTTNRPANWAKPVKIGGVRNSYQVTPSLYRGAQPTAAGMKNLQTLGVKTIINLRAWHSDQDKVAGTGLKSVRFEMEPWRGDTEEVVQFLKIVTDTNQLPVFVHCERGSDRTGMMCAMYRITVCGWTKQQAIQEMEQGGFGFNPVWHELTAFIDKSDIANLKRRAGLAAK